MTKTITSTSKLFGNTVEITFEDNFDYIYSVLRKSPTSLVWDM